MIEILLFFALYSGSAFFPHENKKNMSSKKYQSKSHWEKVAKNEFDDVCMNCTHGKRRMEFVVNFVYVLVQKAVMKAPVDVEKGNFKRE